MSSIVSKREPTPDAFVDSVDRAARESNKVLVRWPLGAEVPLFAARVLPAPMGNAPIAMVDARDLADCAASPFEVHHAVRMAAYFASGADAAPTDAVRRIAGRPPRSLDDFLSDRPHTKGS